MAKMETRQGIQFMNSPAWGGCCRRWKHWWSSSLGILAELWCFGILRLSETLYVPWARRCCWEGGWSVKSTCARAVSSRMIRVARMTNCIKLYQSCQKDLVNPFHTYGLIDPYYRIDAKRGGRGSGQGAGSQADHSHGDGMVMSKYAPLLGSTHTETKVSSRIVLFCSHKILQLLSHQRMKVDFQRCAYLPASTEPSSFN